MTHTIALVLSSLLFSSAILTAKAAPIDLKEFAAALVELDQQDDGQTAASDQCAYPTGGFEVSHNLKVTLLSVRPTTPESGDEIDPRGQNQKVYLSLCGYKPRGGYKCVDLDSFERVSRVQAEREVNQQLIVDGFTINRISAETFGCSIKLWFSLRHEEHHRFFLNKLIAKNLIILNNVTEKSQVVKIGTGATLSVERCDYTDCPKP